MKPKRRTFVLDDAGQPALLIERDGAVLHVLRLYGGNGAQRATISRDAPTIISKTMIVAAEKQLKRLVVKKIRTNTAAVAQTRKNGAL